MGTKKSFRPTEEEQAAYEVATALRTNQRLADLAEKRYHDAIISAKDEAGWTFREIGEVLEQAPSWVYKLYHRRRYARGGRNAYPKGPPKSAQKSHSRT